MKDDRTPGEIQTEIDQIENDIQILRSRKQIEDSECAICNKTGCEVISFIHKKPVHAECFTLSLTNKKGR